jgi:hypothetical protein
MSVIEEKLTIPTTDGAANAYAAYPEGSGPWPVVLLYMDALGVRRTLREMLSDSPPADASYCCRICSIGRGLVRTWTSPRIRSVSWDS